MACYECGSSSWNLPGRCPSCQDSLRKYEEDKRHQERLRLQRHPGRQEEALLRTQAEFQRQAADAERARTEEVLRRVREEGTCDCCGQRFIERTREFPKTGRNWTGLLERHKTNGVCPRCYNEYGMLRQLEVDWTDQEWRSYHGRRVEEATESRLAARLAKELVEGWPDLAARAQARAGDLKEREAKEAAEREERQRNEEAERAAREANDRAAREERERKEKAEREEQQAAENEERRRRECEAEETTKRRRRTRRRATVALIALAGLGSVCLYGRHLLETRADGVRAARAAKKAGLPRWRFAGTKMAPVIIGKCVRYNCSLASECTEHTLGAEVRIAEGAEVKSTTNGPGWGQGIQGVIDANTLTDTMMTEGGCDCGNDVTQVVQVEIYVCQR